jgi:hypothetical protein
LDHDCSAWPKFLKVPSVDANCVQGIDHGTGLSDRAVLGQYAIYTGTFEGLQPEEVCPLKIMMVLRKHFQAK